MDYREISLLAERLEAVEARLAALEEGQKPAPTPQPAPFGAPDVPGITLAGPATNNPWEVTPRA